MLKNREREIDQHWNTFLSVATAFIDIRDNELYSNEYDTFKDYVKGRFPDIGVRHAERLIAASNVTENLRKDTTIEVLPGNERQARELARIKDPEDQAKAWRMAVASTEGFVTAAEVKTAVDAVLPKPKVKKKKAPANLDVNQKVVQDASKKAYKACGEWIRLCDDIAKASGGGGAEHAQVLQSIGISHEAFDKWIKQLLK